MRLDTLKSILRKYHQERSKEWMSKDILQITPNTYSRILSAKDSKEVKISVAGWNNLLKIISPKERMDLFSVEMDVSQLISAGYATAILGSTPDDPHHELAEVIGKVNAFAQQNLTDILIQKGPRIDFSRWDVRALAEATNTLPVRLFDVIQRSGSEAVRDFTASSVSKREEWFHQTNSDSVICFGSPKANHASEIVLAKQFECDPFKRFPMSPIQMRWLDKQTNKRTRDLKSAFCGTLKPPTNSPHSSEVEFAKEVFSTDRILGIPHKTYGVVTIRRMPKGNTSVVISGVSGPGTLGAARELASMKIENLNRQRVYCWLVEVDVFDVANKKESRRDMRRVKGQNIIMSCEYCVKRKLTENVIDHREDANKGGTLP